MMYASLIVVHHLDTLQELGGVSFIKIIADVSVVTTANRYLPIPGGEGTMQLQMRVLLSYDSDSGPVARAGIDDAIFL
jgi:uncharacterized membrane protein YbhN (UPF0104 family)